MNIIITCNDINKSRILMDHNLVPFKLDYFKRFYTKHTLLVDNNPIKYKDKETCLDDQQVLRYLLRLLDTPTNLYISTNLLKDTYALPATIRNVLAFDKISIDKDTLTLSSNNGIDMKINIKGDIDDLLFMEDSFSKYINADKKIYIKNKQDVAKLHETFKCIMKG